MILDKGFSDQRFPVHMFGEGRLSVKNSITA